MPSIRAFKAAFGGGKPSADEVAELDAEVERRLLEVERVIGLAKDATAKVDDLVDKLQRTREARTDAAKLSTTKRYDELKALRGRLTRLEKDASKRMLAAVSEAGAADKLVAGKSDEILDAAVAAIGTQAKSPESKQFVAAAMKQRYGLDVLAGDLSTKALPRLYALFGMVPESHVKDNPKLKQVKRYKHTPTDQADKKDAEGASFYQGAANLIFLNLGKVSASNETFTIEGRAKTVSYFDHTALHEVGHAVDAHLGYMTGPGAQKFDFVEIPFSAVVDHAWTHFDVAADEVLAKLPRSARISILSRLQQKQPLDASAVTYRTTSGLDAAQGRLEDSKTKTTEQVISRAELETALLDHPRITKAVELRRPDLGPAELAALVESASGEAPRGPLTGLDVKPGNTLSPKQAAVVNRCALEVAPKVLQTPVAVDLTKPTELTKVIQRALGPAGDAPSADDIVARLDKHPVVKWLRQVMATKSDDGLWDKGTKGAEKAALDGVVFQMSYAGTDGTAGSGSWVRYDLPLRKQWRVSDYQFRAPGEFFAELYGLYHLGELKDSKYAWIGEIEKVGS